MLSRKTYQMVADTLAEVRNLSVGREAKTVDAVAERLADEFKRDNPRFDRQRFLNATGKGGK